VGVQNKIEYQMLLTFALTIVMAAAFSAAMHLVGNTKASTVRKEAHYMHAASMAMIADDAIEEKETSKMVSKIASLEAQVTKLELLLNFPIGAALAHPVRGSGKVTAVDSDDPHGKPIAVQFDSNGETHRYSVSSAKRLRFIHPNQAA
jgi:hypothetical protein